jgi:hypothetical protein
MKIQELKIKALAKFLECGLDEIAATKYDETTFDAPGGEYMVLTDEEADQKAADYIRESAWAFNANFIIGECGLDFSGEKSLKQMQEKSCEGANDFIVSLIEKTCGMASFIESAISADGRGHFLNTYDGNENEIGADTLDITDEEAEELGETYLYIYQTN